MGGRVSDTSNTDAQGLFTFLLIGFILGFLCAVLLISLTAPNERAEAIKAGVAEYVVNPQTGVTTFKYKEIK